MYTRRPKRKARTAIVAPAIIVAGAGIGWNLAHVIFDGETPPPMVAAVQLEHAQPRSMPEPPRRGYEAAPEPAIAPAPAQSGNYPSQRLDSAAARLPSEDQHLAEALQWAEQYRQNQRVAARQTPPKQQPHALSQGQKVASAEARRWIELAEQTQQVRQPQAEVHRLISAEARQQQPVRPANEQLASAGALAGSALAESKPDRATPATPAAVGSHARRTRHARAAAGRHSRTRRIARTRRVAGYRSARYQADFLCPLRWLEAAFTGEPRQGRRHVRGYGWGWLG